MNIIVTGASKGIGFETVKVLSANAQHNIIAISRNKAGLEKLKTECEKANPDARVTVIPFDLAFSDIQNELVPEIIKVFTDIDVLINNAGTLINKPFEDINPEDVNYVFNVNVFSVIKLIQNLLPNLGRGRQSHIVNIGSMGGFQSSSKFPGLAIYSSSKAALANLSECLAEEFKDKNISVNCLALGAVQTEMLNEAFPGYQAPVSAEKMAEFVAGFALQAHNFLNGKVIPVSLSTP
jgi:short-subunit dehydrogenase